MRIIDCLDKDITDGKERTSLNHSEEVRGLSSNSLEETELIQSIAKLLYKTKSVRKTIEIVDLLSNSEYCIHHEIDPNLDTVVWNNSELSNKEILKNNLERREPYSGC